MKESRFLLLLTSPSSIVPSFLERIADGEVEGMGVFEAIDVIEAGLAGVVWYMEADSPVEAQDEEAEVVADAHTSTHRNVTEETVEAELTLGKARITITLTEVPHITRIEEERSMEVAKELTTVFQVADELDVTILDKVRDGLVVETGKATRTNAPDREGTQTVGTTHVEQLGVREPLAVAKGIDGTGIDVSYELGMAVEGPCLGEVGLQLDKLRVRVLEDGFLLLVPRLSHRHHDE